MRIESYEKLSITECCELLNLKRENLPSALQYINRPSEIDKLLIKQLQSLLNEDKLAIESCRTIEQYEGYLSTWVDGLYRNYAQCRIAQLEEAEELAFYQENKDSISGCEEYIQKYPRGKFVSEVQSILVQKKTAIKTRNIIFIVLFCIINAGIIAYYNYEPVSYIKVDDNVILNNSGSEISLDISTDAMSSIYATSSKDWVHCSVLYRTLYISADTNYNGNGERSATVTITAHSSLFGCALPDSKKKTITIKQEAGYASFLNPSQTNISVSHSGGTRTITVSADGAWEFGAITHSWIDLSRSGNTITLNISSYSGRSNRHDYFTIKSGNLVKRINITQTADSTPRANVNNVWTEHNIPRTEYNQVYDSYYGWQSVPKIYNVMCIHVDFDVDNMKDKTIRVCAFFYDEDGNKMKSSSNEYKTRHGQVTVQRTATAPYTNSSWSNFTMEIPYSAITKGKNKFVIHIQDNNGEHLGESDYQYFTCY